MSQSSDIALGAKERWTAYRSAALNVVSADRLAVVHCVESRYFVHAHWRHLQQSSDLVHNTDASPSVVLALSEIEKRHDCSFFILAGVSREDFLDESLICFAELEWDGRVVVGCVAVLSNRYEHGPGRQLPCRLHTTMIAALDVRGVEVKVRHCDEILFAGRRALEALLSMIGASFEAMAVCIRSTRI